MKIIIQNADDWMWQVRAARSAIDDGIVEGGLYGISFAGAVYGVKRNKDSVRVYPPSTLQLDNEE